MAHVTLAEIQQHFQEGVQEIPAGDYEAVIEAEEVKQAQTGSWMLRVNCRIAAGPYAGRKLWTNLATLGKSKDGDAVSGKKLILAGIKDFSTMFATAGDVETFLRMCAAEVHGTGVRVTTKAGEYNGVPRTEITRVMAVPGAAWAAPEFPGLPPVPSAAPHPLPSRQPPPMPPDVPF
jgi:uncharacterized protein DUF669